MGLITKAGITDRWYHWVILLMGSVIGATIAIFIALAILHITVSL